MISAASIRSLNLGIGIAEADLDLPRSLFYDTLSRAVGPVRDGRRRPDAASDQPGRHPEGV